MDKYPHGLLSEAPYGVIFDGNRVVIGSPHGEPVQLSPDLRRRVQSVAKRYGAYYEGDGKDIEPLSGLLGSAKNYKGSWDDDLVAKGVDGYPMEFLSSLFGNVKENGYVEKFTDPKLSIFDSLLKNQKRARYFPDRTFSEKTLREFLQYGSENGVDFISLSSKPATKENLKDFFAKGEKLANPPNWLDYPNKLGKLMKRAEDIRNRAILSGPPGVYVAGAGHLPELVRMKKNLRMIGGERASE